MNTKIFLWTVFVVVGLVAASPVLADTYALLTDAIKDYEAGKLDVAKAKFQKALEEEPGNTIATYYIGVIYLQKGEADAAVPYFEKVSKSADPVEGIDELLADTYISAGMPEKALVYYGKKYEADPGNEKTAFSYASSLQEAGRENQAMGIYRSLIESGGEYKDASHYQVGVILSDRGAYKSAIEQFKAVDILSPYSEPAYSYMDSLAPSARFLSFYGSAQFFYRENPDATDFGEDGEKQSKAESIGATLVGQLNTRGFELADRVQAMVGYMFFGTFYFDDETQNQKFLSRNINPFLGDYFGTSANNLDLNGIQYDDFIGHYVNPTLSYHLGSSIDLQLKGDMQFFSLNQQSYSSNMGGTVAGTWTTPGNHSIMLRGSYLESSYTDSFKLADSTVSLKYQDAKTLSVGLGMVFYADLGSSLSLEYSFNDERPINKDDPVLGPAAKDNRYTEHVIQVDVMLPLFSHLSVLGSMNYSSKDYTNIQSGESFPSAAGKNITVELFTYGGKVQVLFWKAINLKLLIGMERTHSTSIATELDYKRNIYYVQITTRY